MIPVFFFCRKPFLVIEKGTFVDYLNENDGFNIIIQESDPQQIVPLFQQAVAWCETNRYDFFLVSSLYANIPTNFDEKCFASTVELGIKYKADVLIYSAVAVNSPLPTQYGNLYWIDSAFGINCMVVYRSAFKQILSLPKEWDPRYEVTSILTQNLWRKLLVSPYVRREKDSHTVDCALYTNSVRKQQELYRLNYESLDISYEDFCVPVYIINLPERKERLEHVLREFQGRSEFEVNVVPACKDECGAFGLWKSIRRIVSIAMEKDEDVIVICEDDHQFTSDYSKEFLFTRIMEGYALGADYLNGGCGDFRDAFVITEHLFGMVTIRCTQFIIIYKDFFSTILNANFDKNVLADVKLSELTERKMVIYPFVSVQRDFGYSDVTMIFNQNDGLITSMFENARKRLENIKRLSEEEALLQHSKVISS